MKTWYQCVITVCAELSAASVIIQFWNKDINPAAWITLLIALILCLNLFAVSVYGEAEFCFASIKIVAIVGLVIFAFIIDLGGGPTKDRLGFRYWNHPGAMKAYIAEGSTGRFLGLWSVLVNATFAYEGVEMFAVAAGEAKNPRVNIPKAVRRVFWRILFFYVIGSLAIGVLIPYNEPRLLKAQKLNAPGGAASPWVIAIYRAGVPVLPSIVNAIILISAASSANAFLYIGSRYLFALAQNGQAPKFLLQCSKKYVSHKQCNQQPPPPPNILFFLSYSILIWSNLPGASPTTASSPPPPSPSSPTCPARPPPPQYSPGFKTSSPSPCSSPGCPSQPPTSNSTPRSKPRASAATPSSSNPLYSPTWPGSASSSSA